MKRYDDLITLTFRQNSWKITLTFRQKSWKITLTFRQKSKKITFTCLSGEVIETCLPIEGW